VYIKNQRKNVVASATAAEVAAYFLNAQDACVHLNTLADLGHPQPPTPIQTDNQCAQGILTNTVKQKWSKAIDMQSSGSMIPLLKNGFMCIGIQDCQTWQTTLPSITP
jgi:hypothetical protein